MGSDLDHLLARIRTLLADYESGTVPPRSVIEPLLTEGYAKALSLDAECLRLERKIDRITAALAEGASAPKELPKLIRRINAAEQEISTLRAALAPLRRLVARAA